MATITINAHYDGERVLLDEPVTLPVNARLMVTVLPVLPEDRTNWMPLAMQALSHAYGGSEPEYSIKDIKK
jgi:hypothetical protein